MPVPEPPDGPGAVFISDPFGGSTLGAFWSRSSSDSPPLMVAIALNTSSEIDSLMKKQLVTMEYRPRKKIYDRVQEVLAEQLPMIYLVSPNILMGAREDLGNFRPAIIEQYTFWNADELFWHTPAGKH